MTSEFKKDMLGVMVKHRVISETFARDEIIRDEYFCKPKNERTGKLREELAAKHNIDIKTIGSILYDKNRDKKFKKSEKEE